VLQEQIRKYKDVFVQAVSQAIKLDEALSQYFGEAQPVNIAGNSSVVHILALFKKGV
jgi:hypothetical protein